MPRTSKRRRSPAKNPIADAIESIASTVGRLEKKLDRMRLLEGERHTVELERFKNIDKQLGVINKSLGGLQLVVKTNNDLARDSHKAVIHDMGLVKERIRKLELETESKDERGKAAGRTETVRKT